jgi:hypothetical protein
LCYVNLTLLLIDANFTACDMNLRNCFRERSKGTWKETIFINLLRKQIYERYKTRTWDASCKSSMQLSAKKFYLLHFPECNPYFNILEKELKEKL